MNRSIFHVAKGMKYHVGNSLRGIRKAIRRRFWAIDLDILITKDGVIVGCHWSRPMLRDGFYDPLGKIPPGTPIHQLTWAQVATLRTKDGYRIQRIERLLQECGPKIIAYLEPKSDARFELDWPWLEIKQAAHYYDCRIKVRSIRNLGGKGAGTRRVAAARRNGIAANTIY